MPLKDRKWRWLISCVLFALTISAQDRTGVSGIVVDSDTGEPIPFVQIYFIKPTSEGTAASSIGTTSDVDGNFIISTLENYTTVNFQMVGYKTEMLTLRKGNMMQHATIKMQPDIYGLQDIVVVPKHRKRQYKRKGNPAVELIRNVIAHKDSATVKTADFYTADTYTRTSFALDNFTPNFEKGFWRSCSFVQNYIDTGGVYPSLTVSIRENIADEYYQRSPRRDKIRLKRKRIFGLEDLLTTTTLKKNIDAIFTEVDINNDNMNLLFNRFVSPLSGALAVSYYQYYIMDTIMVDGYSCIDLAFVPVNSESYSFTGHLYILNDSTYKIKKYAINIPPHINLNFVSDFSIEQSFVCLPNGLWAAERTKTFAKFYITNRKKTLLARQTKIYNSFDFDTPIDGSVFSSMLPVDTLGPTDTISIREDLALWEKLRPEPLTFYESSVMDMLQQFKQTPKFNTLIMAVDALTSEYVATVPAVRWGESKWDFGPIYSTISWNMLEGVRLRIGGMTTANLHPNLFFMGYAAFGSADLRPKYNATILYSIPKKKYQPFEPLRHYVSVSAQYDVEEPGCMTGILERDNIFMSIPSGKPVMRNYQYVFRARAFYMKEWPNKLTIKTWFDFENNAAAGALSYNRIIDYNEVGKIMQCKSLSSFDFYQLGFEVRYSPGSDFPINRQGVETPFTLEQDAPVIALSHKMGFIDDWRAGGQGYMYQYTEVTAEKRFWFSSFGHLDARLQAGYIWHKTPFMKLYSPATSTSIFLSKNAFNLMQPMEFLMDRYIGLYMTYFFKGWILNRIPGINRLKLRGVVSFSGIYGYLSDKNNPFLVDGAGLYKFPDNASYDANGNWESGYVSSPIGKLPYMEITAGLENILKFIRIDYVRRLTYNDYILPDGIHRRSLGGWGRNGVKVTVRFEF